MRNDTILKLKKTLDEYAAKIAHHEKPLCFLENIERMNRLPVGFEYRLLKDMITL